MSNSASGIGTQSGSTGGRAISLRDSSDSMRSSGRLLNGAGTEERGGQRGCQAIEVTPRSVGVTAQDLRRHVLGRESDDVRRGDRLCGEQPGDAEVAQLDPAVQAEQHVSRLDVTVEDAHPVGSAQGVGDRNADPRHGGQGLRSTGGDEIAERAAIEVFGDEIRLARR